MQKRKTLRQLCVSASLGAHLLYGGSLPGLGRCRNIVSSVQDADRHESYRLGQPASTPTCNPKSGELLK